jgi:hypothetical protein
MACVVEGTHGLLGNSGLAKPWGTLNLYGSRKEKGTGGVQLFGGSIDVHTHRGPSLHLPDR